MQKYLPVESEVGEPRDGAVVAGHRDMAHALAGLVAEPGLDHLVVLPHRAVEEHQRGAVDLGLERVGDLGAGGDEVNICRSTYR